MTPGFVAKIFVKEGDEVPTKSVRVLLVSKDPLRDMVVLNAVALLATQPVMVTVEEAEDIAAFSVRPVNLYFLCRCCE